MLERFKNHCSRPITYGVYYKWAGISMALSLVYTAAFIIKIKKDAKNYNNTDLINLDDYLKTDEL